MSDRNSGRARAVDRLRSLAAMTVENGCTEAEAARAREAAKRVRARFGITDEDLSVATDEAEEADEDFVFVQARSYPSPDNSRHLHPVVRIAGDRIAEHFRCRSFFSGVDLVLIGDEADAAAAHAFLAGVIQASSFHLEGFKHYLKSQDDANLHPRTIASEFRKGMGTRLYARLDEFNSQGRPATGQDVVLSSPDKLDDMMSEILPHLSWMKSPFRSEITWAFSCGWIAGAYLRLPGEEGGDEPIDWAEELAHAAKPVGNGGPQSFSTREAPKPKRRTIRSALKIFLADLKWSTGRALHRVGWIIGLAAAIGYAIDPSPDSISRALGFDVTNIIFVGLAMVFIGEALDGDGPRPLNERRCENTQRCARLKPQDAFQFQDATWKKRSHLKKRRKDRRRVRSCKTGSTLTRARDLVIVGRAILTDGPMS